MQREKTLYTKNTFYNPGYLWFKLPTILILLLYTIKKKDIIEQAILSMMTWILFL